MLVQHNTWKMSRSQASQEYMSSIILLLSLKVNSLKSFAQVFHQCLMMIEAEVYMYMYTYDMAKYFKTGWSVITVSDHVRLECFA